MTAKPANAKPARATKAQEAADLRVMQNDIKHLSRWQYIMSYAIITGFALMLAVHAGALLWVDTELGDMYTDMNAGFVELEGRTDAKFAKLEGRVDDKFARMDERLDRQYELLLQMQTACSCRCSRCSNSCNSRCNNCSCRCSRYSCNCRPSNSPPAGNR